MPTIPQRSYSRNLKRDHLWLLAWKAARWVAYLHMRHVERGGWTPVPIAASKGARLAGWSESTWRRAVVAAEAFGWLERQVRSGRVKGNPRGYNPGSLYMPRYQALQGGLGVLTGRSARPRSLPPDGRDSYSETGKEPSQSFRQPSQIPAASRSERVQDLPLKVPESVFVRGPNLDPVLSKERETGRGPGHEVQAPPPNSASGDLEHPSPTPSLKERGNNRQGIPTDVVAAVRAVVGPPLTDEQRARLERERARRLRAAAEGGHGN